MKRLIISALILSTVVAASFARYNSRNSSRNTTRKIIQLAEPKRKGSISFEEVLSKRRSVRQYENRPVGLSQVGQLAWAGQGITDPVRGLRTAPSAGELYPINLYFATPEGLFIYHAREHTLEQTVIGDVRGLLGDVPLAPCLIIVVGSSKKPSPRSNDKSKTYMLLEAGHIAQNICLQAVALGLGSVTVGEINTRQITRACKLPRYTEAIYIISVGYPLTQGTAGDSDNQNAMGQDLIAQGKKAALIIPGTNFRDDEFVETKRALEMAGAEIVVVSARRGIIKGMLGSTVEAKVLLSGLRVDDYDAIVFIGGPGVTEYFDDPTVRSIVRNAATQRKVLAAISAAPTVLANAGVLTGRRATAFMSEKEKLQQGGAVFTGAPIERDAFIITCSGPAAARQFGRAIAEAIAGR